MKTWRKRADGVYMDSSACKAWDAWQAAHLAGQRAMQTRAEEVANKIAERILAANTHRGRTSSAGSFASGVAEDIAELCGGPSGPSERAPS